MKIVIEENDSFIQPDNIATMIVVAVTKQDGKVVRFPYSAARSMGALIADINCKIGDATTSERESPPLPFITDGVLVNPKPPESYKQLVSDGKIKKEDLVRCIKINDRGKDAPIDFEIGGIYRVLKVTMNGPYVASYDVIDDTDFHKADIPRRLMMFPNEVEFYQKRKPPVLKEVGRFEEFYTCEQCQKKVVAYRMDDDKYHGRCDDCNLSFIHDKPTVAA